MRDTMLNDWLEQIDTVTLELAEINLGDPMPEAIRLESMLVQELTILNKLVELRIKQLYPVKSLQYHYYRNLHVRALVFAGTSTSVTVLMGVYVVPWVHMVAASL